MSDSEKIMKMLLRAIVQKAIDNGTLVPPTGMPSGKELTEVCSNCGNEKGFHSILTDSCPGEGLNLEPKDRPGTKFIGSGRYVDKPKDQTSTEIIPFPSSSSIH